LLHPLLGTIEADGEATVGVSLTAVVTVTTGSLVSTDGVGVSTVSDEDDVTSGTSVDQVIIGPVDEIMASLELEDDDGTVSNELDEDEGTASDELDDEGTASNELEDDEGTASELEEDDGTASDELKEVTIELDEGSAEDEDDNPTADEDEL